MANANCPKAALASSPSGMSTAITTGLFSLRLLAILSISSVVCVRDPDGSCPMKDTAAASCPARSGLLGFCLLPWGHLLGVAGTCRFPSACLSWWTFLRGHSFASWLYFELIVFNNAL